MNDIHDNLYNVLTVIKGEIKIIYDKRYFFMFKFGPN